MTGDDLSKNERFLQHARTSPFWAYIALGALVAVGGAFAVEVADVDVKIAYLAGMGAATLLDVPIDWFQDWAELRANGPETEGPET